MLYQHTVQQFVKMLNNLDAMLDKAVAVAETRRFDVANLLNARLAPDQFNFIRQVQIACDNAKYSVSRLTGKEAPVHEDNEKTVAEIKARIASVIGYLSTIRPEDFNGFEERQITMIWWNGKQMSGSDYAVQYVVPNFYFHLVTAYAILRHNGVDLGKADYLGELPLH